MGGVRGDIELKGVPCLWPSDCKRPGASVSLGTGDHKVFLLPFGTCSTLMNSQECIGPIRICLIANSKHVTTDVISMLLFYF